MPVRKTESRIPAGLAASDLGEAVVSADSRCALVAFVTTPVPVDRDNTYVVFVTDPALAATAETFEWTFTESGDAPQTFTTTRGVTTYSPVLPGPLSVTVHILGAGVAVLATLTLDQYIVKPSAEVESEIEAAVDAPGPGAGNPEVLRELVNEHSRYYQAVTPQAPEAGDAFRRLTYSFVWDGAQRRDPRERAMQIERLADALNSGSADFVSLIVQGVGVSDLRLGLLAMVPLTGAALLPWTEFPESGGARAIADEKLCAAVGALSETARIDLFNLARFPKTNIRQCARTLETLRDRYFPGATFQEVLTGLSGTRAHWITRHFREGPLKRV